MRGVWEGSQRSLHACPSKSLGGTQLQAASRVRASEARREEGSHALFRQRRRIPGVLCARDVAEHALELCLDDADRRKVLEVDGILRVCVDPAGLQQYPLVQSTSIILNVKLLPKTIR